MEKEHLLRKENYTMHTSRTPCMQVEHQLPCHFAITSYVSASFKFIVKSMHVTGNESSEAF